MSAALNAIPTPVFEAAAVLIAGSTTIAGVFLAYVIARSLWGAHK